MNPDLFAILATVSVTLGVGGFSAMTWFFLVLARALYRSRSPDATDGIRQSIKSIAILIPARNEERTLPLTLASVLDAAKNLEHEYPGLKLDIYVGADGCTDNTVGIASSFRPSFNNLHIIESHPNIGKWRMLQKLVRSASDADWVVLADSGILWPQNLLTACLPYCEQPDVIGVAPSYRNPSAGIAENIVWRLESFIKTLENPVGGPIAVHGTTVLYQQKALTLALAAFNTYNIDWINDDVVISLYLRLIEPNSRIIYVPQVIVRDSAESHLDNITRVPIRQLNRRKRMVYGNHQWMKAILLPHWHLNVIAALIALRRVFRVFWAYWSLALAPAVYLTMGWRPLLSLSALVLVVGLLSLGPRSILALLDAWYASLLAPYCIMYGRSFSKWK